MKATIRIRVCDSLFPAVLQRSCPANDESVAAMMMIIIMVLIHKREMTIWTRPCSKFLFRNMNEA